MANEKLMQAGRDAGVNSGDVAVLERVGLTPALVKQASEHGWSMKDLWELFQQHGPTIITFLTSLFSRGKGEEAKQAKPDKPKPESDGKGGVKM
jgi:hypothetical protein